MKTSNVEPHGLHATAATRGQRSALLAGAKGMLWKDAATESVGQIRYMTVVGATFVDNEDGTGVLIIGDGSGGSVVLPSANAPIIAALSNPPTQAELEDAVNSAASEVPGQAYIVTDSDSGRGYIVWSNGSSFVFVPMVGTASDLTTIAAAAGIFSDFTAMWCAAQYDAASDTTFWAYLNAAGDVCVRSYDHATQTASAATVLHAALSAGDTHAQPALLIRSSDRKIIVAYSAHAGANLYIRISSSAADISAFGSETDIDSSVGGTTYTYPVLHELSDGIYLFVRTYAGVFPSADFMWSYTKSTDNGATWGAKVDLANESGGELYWMPSKANSVFAVSAGDRIDFMCSDKSPFGATTPVSLFHFYLLAGGGIFQTDGTEITATKPIATASMTPMWTATGSQRGDPGQILIAPDGKPRAVFRDFEDTSPEDARYMWALWDGSAWSAYEVAAAGSGSQTATCVFADGDPYTVYYSKDVAGVAQIFKATTPDEGVSWVHTQITDSANENVLLATVRDAAPELKVMWAAKSGGWTRDDTVAADFLGAASVAASGVEVQRLVALFGSTLGDGLGEIMFRWNGGVLYVSDDGGATWDFISASANPSSQLLTVDAGTPTYDDSGDDLVVTYASDWGYDADGPYYDATGAAAGEEAILAIDPSSGELAVIPYNP